MINQEMLKVLNEQITKEMFSSNLYLSMASYFADTNFKGFSHWMHLQAQEEMMHAMKIFTYILDRGGRPIIDALDKPRENWSSPLEAFTNAYEHEQLVTASIYNLVDVATNLKDHATVSFLRWFVDEQVEEEATASEIVERLKLAGDSTGGLFILDKELMSRQAGPQA